MAIDSTLFAATIPAAALAVGDRIPLAVIRGPAVVRDGYGKAILKRFFAATTSTAMGHVEVKNSNWVDAVANIAPSPGAVTLNNNSNAIQSGHDAELFPNSGWQVDYVVDAASTPGSAGDVFVLIDIDYPSVQAVANPKSAQGVPSSIIRQDSMVITATGSSPSMTWTTVNVDILKAGIKYLLDSAYFRAANCNLGFFSISGAAGQSGLERIIPAIPNSISNLRYEIDYSTPLVKGPFNINYAGVGTAGSTAAVLELDWVKNKN